jgi:hypothetical protein
VGVKFEHIFPGKGVRGWKVDRQALIYRVATGTLKSD